MNTNIVRALGVGAALILIGCNAPTDDTGNTASNVEAKAGVACTEDGCDANGKAFTCENGVFQEGENCAAHNLLCDVDNTGTAYCHSSDGSACAQDECDGDVQVFCNGGEPVNGQDCASMGMHCLVTLDPGADSTDPTAWHAGCVAPCTEDTCDGESPVFCMNGAPQRGEDCSQMGQICDLTTGSDNLVHAACAPKCTQDDCAHDGTQTLMFCDSQSGRYTSGIDCESENMRCDASSGSAICNPDTCFVDYLGNNCADEGFPCSTDNNGTAYCLGKQY